MLNFKKPRTLLLDDDPSMQRLITKLLQDAGFRVDCVSTGRMAIEHIHRFEYDALLLDVMMPTEGAMTVIRHLRESNPELIKRVILVTASPPAGLRAIVKEVNAVITKPFRPDDLVGAVRRLLAA